MTHYVLLCRHARHRAHKLTPDESGYFPIEVVAERLREQLFAAPGPDLPQLCLDVVRYPKSPEAVQTVALLGRGLGCIETQASELGSARWDRVTPAHAGHGFTGRIRVALPREPDEPEKFMDPPVRVELSLDLEPWHAAAAPEVDTDIASGLLEEAQRRAVGAGNAVLLVGHMPQLGRIADELARHPDCPARRRRRLQVPLAQGEIACLVFGRPRFPGNESGAQAPDSRTPSIRSSAHHRLVPRLPSRLRYRSPRVLWTIAPTDSAALEDIRAKIRSKMQTATVLGGVLTAILSALLAVLFDQGKWDGLEHSGGFSWLSGQEAIRLSAGLLLAAIALYFATVYSYDRLLMPPRFWGEARPRRSWRGRSLVSRPPSSSTWILYQNMQRVWWGLFTPATLSVGTALAVMAVVFLRVSGWALVGLAGALSLVGALVWWFRPVLGSED